MQKFLSIVFIFSLNGSACFRLKLVHHQKQHFNKLYSAVGTFVPVHLAAGYKKGFLYPYSSQTYCTNVPTALYSLLKCCSWWWTNDSLKHAEPFNEKIKVIHKNLCISLVYIHTAIWCTVHTSKSILDISF